LSTKTTTVVYNFNRSALEDLEVGDVLTVKQHEHNVIAAYSSAFRQMGKEVVFELDSAGWKVRRIS
tara:strand:+ start:302 stop:499 length:198 start_codon:yes stop_codon:yes gene_type:complete